MNQREKDFLSLINMLSDSSKNRGIEPYKRTIINILNGNIKSTNAIVFSDLEIFGKYKNFNSPIFDLMISKYSQHIRIDSSKKNQRFFSPKIWILYMKHPELQMSINRNTLIKIKS